MSRAVRRAVALTVACSVVAMTIGVADAPVTAQPAHPNGIVPPIIGNTALGIGRDLDGPLCTSPTELCSMPASYYAAIDVFEDAAVRKVLADHDLPGSDYTAVMAWGRDAVRTQLALDLLAIINKPEAQRTTNEALVYSWMQQMYKINTVNQAQFAVDEYLRWSGLTMGTIHLDPVAKLPNSNLGYCQFEPPGNLNGGFGLFDGTYNASDLPQCNIANETACTGGATGCPIPWPTLQQFQQWGRYLAQRDFIEDPVMRNLLSEAAVGIGLAASMAATGAATALARSYLAAQTAGTSLFKTVFPFSYRAGQLGGEIARNAAQTAARASSGVIRAGSAAFVVGTVITAIVTIGLEAWTIAEHQQIPVKLLDALDKARAQWPDLSALARTETGVSAVLSTFLATTRIDVDPDCTLPTAENGYSHYPCAHAPAPMAPTATDDLFFVTRDLAGEPEGELSSWIYPVNPLESTGGIDFSAERITLGGNGWFVGTKFDPQDPGNRFEPINPGSSFQSVRLYYRDWNGVTRVAERFVDDDGTPKFVVAAFDPKYVGQCATPGTGGATLTCVTDTIYFTEPNGARVSARIVDFDATLPDVTAVVPDRAVAGQQIALSASASPSEFGTGEFRYRWTLPGSTVEGATVSAPITTAGQIVARLTVFDADDDAGTNPLVTEEYPILVAQNTDIHVGVDPGGARPFGTSPRVWAVVLPRIAEGIQCSWDLGAGTSGCVRPTGSVQFEVDGVAVGDPVPVTDNFLPPCTQGAGGLACSWTFGQNRVYAPFMVLDAITSPAGTDHVVTASYFGDDKFIGSTNTNTFTVDPGVSDVVLTSGTSLPGPTQPVTLTATVRAVAGSRGVPTGTANLMAVTSTGNIVLPVPAAPLDSSGTATFRNVTLQYVNELAVRFNGDANFATATSVGYPLTFQQPPSSATVTPSSATVGLGANVQLSVTIRDASGTPVPGASIVTSPSGASGTTDADGRTTVTVNSAVEGPITFTFTANGVPVTGSAVVTWGTSPDVLNGAVTGEVGVPLSVPITVSGVPAPTISTTALPAGLRFDPAAVSVVGTPTVSGTTQVSITATSPLGTDVATLTISVLPAVSIATTGLAAARVGVDYQAGVSVSGGSGPFRFGATGLPAGLTINPDTGGITGRPTVAGTSNVALTVTDQLGATARKVLPLTVQPAVPAARPDLVLALGSSTFTSGRAATYALTVTNAGRATAAGPLVLAVDLPAGVGYTSRSGSEWACAAVQRRVVCVRARSLAAGQRSTLTLNVRVTARRSTVLTTTAGVVGPSAESTMTNNTARRTVTVR